MMTFAAVTMAELVGIPPLTTTAQARSKKGNTYSGQGSTVTSCRRRNFKAPLKGGDTGIGGTGTSP